MCGVDLTLVTSTVSEPVLKQNWWDVERKTHNYESNQNASVDEVGDVLPHKTCERFVSMLYNVFYQVWVSSITNCYFRYLI